MRTLPPSAIGETPPAVSQFVGLGHVPGVRIDLVISDRDRNCTRIEITPRRALALAWDLLGAAMMELK